MTAAKPPARQRAMARSRAASLPPSYTTLGDTTAAAIYTLIETAKLNRIDPQAWLADVLARLPDHPAKRIGNLLPWSWASSARIAAAA
jgi:hypothetical protein